MKLAELKTQYRRELKDLVIPFWERYGLDQENGGFFCSLDYDGTLINTAKHDWFQGRGLWVFSHLYDRFSRHPRHLEIACQAKEFVLSQVQRMDDLYGKYFAAEGLMEYAGAAADSEAREEARRLFLDLRNHIDNLESRPQGLWMLNLEIATQWLRRWDDDKIRRIADEALDAILNRHYNPETGLNTEVLRRDFSRTEEEANKCVLGHSVECLWMALDEALRRGDSALADLCCERLRRHLDVGWDHVYGGLADAVKVDAVHYHWPEERLVGTDIESREVGEYRYRKSYWAVNEVLIAAMKAYEHTHAEWAARYFELAQRVADEKFSLAWRDMGSHMVISDRKITWQPKSVRQDNYHPPRRLMHVLESMENLEKRTTA